MPVRSAALLLLSTMLPVAEPADWHPGPLEQAIDEAKRRDRHLLLVFVAPDSAHCDRFRAESLESDAARSALELFLLLEVDAATAEGAALIGRFGVSLLPTVVALSPDGEPQEALPGYRPQGQFAGELRNVLNGQGTVGALRRQSKRKPRDLDLRLKLAMKLGSLGCEEAAAEQLDAIRRLDPRGKTEPGARLALRDAVERARSDAADPQDLTAYDPRPVEELLGKIRQPSVLHHGWRWIASVQQAKGDQAAARRSLATAYPHVPPGEALDWLAQTARAFWSAGDQLTRDEKRTALSIARAAADVAEKALPSTPEADRVELIDAFAVLALCHDLNGQRSKARGAIKRGLEIVPDSEELRRIGDSLAKR